MENRSFENILNTFDILFIMFDDILLESYLGKSYYLFILDPNMYFQNDLYLKYNMKSINYNIDYWIRDYWMKDL